MQSKQFPTFDEAKAYLESRGKLVYGGREGTDANTYVYTLTIGIKVYHLFLYEDGLLKVTHERYL